MAVQWYGDLRGAQTVKVSSDYMNKADSLQGIAAIDRTNKKATVLYGGANDANADQVKNDGSNIPVTVHLTGLDQNLFGSTVDVEVRERMPLLAQMVLQLLLEWSMRYPM